MAKLFPYLAFENAKNSIAYYETEFRLFYQEAVKKYGWELATNPYLYEHSLLLFSFFIDQKKYRPKIRMKFFSSGGKILELSLKEKFKTIVNNLEIDNSNTTDVDIIVSDYLITSDTKERVFYWSVQPTEKEWNGFLDTLLKIEQTKTVSEINLDRRNLCLREKKY